MFYHSRTIVRNKFWRMYQSGAELQKFLSQQKRQRRLPPFAQRSQVCWIPRSGIFSVLYFATSSADVKSFFFRAFLTTHTRQETWLFSQMTVFHFQRSIMPLIERAEQTFVELEPVCKKRRHAFMSFGLRPNKSLFPSLLSMCRIFPNCSANFRQMNHFGIKTAPTIMNFVSLGVYIERFN